MQECDIPLPPESSVGLGSDDNMFPLDQCGDCRVQCRSEWWESIALTNPLAMDQETLQRPNPRFSLGYNGRKGDTLTKDANAVGYLCRSD
jgi:hypothetical protein